MSPLRQVASRSFGGKLIRLVMIATAAAVLLVCAILVTVIYYRNLRLAEHALVAQSRMIGLHVTAALSFNDPEAATETLHALAPVREFASAALYKPTGELFASYRRADRPGPLFIPRSPGLRYEEGWLVNEHVIVHNAQPLGVIVVAYDLGFIHQALRSNIILALAAGVLASCLSLLLALRLHAQLARPVEALITTARAVTDTNDFSLRAPRLSDDEIGRFTDVFNDMLRRIGEQADEIAKTHSRLTDTNEELRQKNAEMEQFVYTVSHDLKSPLVTAMGFVGLLKEDVAAGRTAELMESVEHIARAARRMSRLIDDLLQLSRIGRVRNDPEPVDLGEMLRLQLDDLGPRLEKANALVEVQPNMPTLVVDRARIQQVFENLLVNAIKYGSSSPQPRITIGWRWGGNDVRLFVRDNGPGIAPEYHDRIFGLFQRLDSHSEGTGIGLAIVARIMEVHGGRAWVDSSPQRGATFWLSFPGSVLASPSHPHTRK